jgi:hypothetical protein
MKIYLIRSIFFLVIFFSIFLITGLNKTLLLRPQSIHQWAQCDRASVALNFSRDTYNIFKPQIHYQSRGDGIAGMEFPFVNYMVGMFYRLFGFHEAIYRIFMSFILATGLLAAFRMSFLLLKNIYYSFYAVLLFLLSPVLLYYTPNFIPDTAGLGLTLIGWYFYFRWKESGISKHLWYVTLFLTLACLIKITGIISVVTMLILIFIPENQNRLNKSRNIFSVLVLIIPIFLTAGWYYYANWLSIKHGSAAFLLDWRPVMDFNQMTDIIAEIKKTWFKQYYSKYFYYFLVFTIAIITLMRKHCDKRLLKITLLLWTGNIIFFILMLQQFPNHDYYIIALLPVILFQILTFFSVINSIFEKTPNIRKAMFLIIFILSIHGIIFCKKTIHDRYRQNSWMVSNPVFNNYFNITPYVRSLGIKYDDLVISANDPSFNISLYLMDCKGTTLSLDSKPEDIESTYFWKPKYLILNDSTQLNRYLIHGFTAHHLGTQNNIYFYRLTNTGKPNE